MKFHKTLISLVVTLATLLSCNEAANNGNNEETLLGLYYGMEFDTTTYDYAHRDTVIEKLDNIVKREFCVKGYHNIDSLKYNLSLGLYIDKTYPSKEVFKVIEQCIDTEMICGLGYYHEQKPFLDERLKNVPKSTEEIFSFGNKILHEIAKEHKPLFADSLYYKIHEGRVCIISHKIFENDEIATYIVEGTIDYHGSCGCNSKAIYVSVNKSTGKVLTLNDILKEYDIKDVWSKVLDGYKTEYKKKEGSVNEIMTANTLQKRVDGCAIVKEGILFYYLPYNISCGAEGQYNIIIK